MNKEPDGLKLRDLTEKQIVAALRRKIPALNGQSSARIQEQRAIKQLYSLVCRLNVTRGLAMNKEPMARKLETHRKANH